MKKIILILLILFLPTILLADIKKVKVIDGDTIHVGNVKYRLFGIDAPEIKQLCEKNNKKIECGVIAKNLLKIKIGNKIPECIVKDKDRYQRFVAECFVDKESLSKFMVREG